MPYETELLDAARRGDISEMKKYLSKGAQLDARARDRYGMTVLLYAAWNGHLAVVKWLVDEKKVDVTVKSKNGATALLWAVGNGHLAVMQWLVDAKNVNVAEKNNDGATALLYAAVNGQLAVMQWLVDEKKVSVAEKSNDGSTALLYAAQRGHLPMVQWLVDEKKVSVAEKDNGGMTALLWAAWYGHLPVMQWLVDAKKVSVAEKNNDGSTALLRAADGGRLPVMQWLVDEKKVSVAEKSDDGNTALLRAAQGGHLAAMQWLADEKKVSVAEKDNDGMTALLWAAYSGHLPVIQWLVDEKKVNLEDKNNNGNTALDLARKQNKGTVAKYLIQALKTQASTVAPKVVSLPASAPNSLPVPTSPAATANSATELSELLNKANEYYVDGKYAEAVKWYRKAAIRGDATAEKWVVSLEELLLKTKSIPPPPAEKPSIEKQEPEKEEKATPAENFKRAEKYYEKKEYEKAKRYYQRAAKEKHPGAEARLKEIERLLSASSPSVRHQPDKSPPTPPTSLTPPAPIGASATERLVDEKGDVKISFAIAYQELQFGKELGRGAYGVVYQGMYQYNSVAIKKLLNQELKASLVEEFKQEASIMANLHSEHVVRLYGICLEKSQYSLVMEYLPKGSLYGLLQNEEPLSWTLRYQIGLDIACGMAYLHMKNVIHADLKSLNVLLDKNNQAKISDFGLSKVKSTGSVSTLLGQTTGGSTRWMAPELFEEEGAKSTKASDVFSYGVVLWELGARKVPFATSRNEAVSRLVEKGKRETITEDTPSSMAHLIAKCWDSRAKQRPSMSDAVNMLREHQEEVESAHETRHHAHQKIQPAVNSAVAHSTVVSQFRDNLASGAALLKPAGENSTGSQTNSAGQSDFRGNTMSKP